MKKLITRYFLLPVLLLMLFFGCTKKQLTHPEQITTSTDEISISTNTEENISVWPKQLHSEEENTCQERVSFPKEWTSFQNKIINFSFDYPSEWVNTKLNDKNNIKIEFKSPYCNESMTIVSPNPAVGLEFWNNIKTDIIKTSDEKTDIFVQYFKINEEILGKIKCPYPITAQWKTGLNKKSGSEDFILRNIAGIDKSSGKINFNSCNQAKINLDIVNKIIHSINFN